MRIDFEMLGERQVSREILGVGQRATNAAPAFASIADDITDWTEEQFTTEGGRSGGWAQLAPSTVKSRGSAHPILRVHGDLMREMTNRASWIITDDFAHFQPEDEQARIGGFHQSGTVKMPQRRIFDFSLAERAEIVRKIQFWVVKGRLL